ncbi:M20 family metallopeptidase [Acidovorax sp. NCPPB 4044]|uniref:M20 family metallopeptidase n=1 Tax=Acidovorax sp. NCPPB 4044 TaxID=2940490 RepID=UPI0023048684|nr:M20 family metallopeptidase [Acidovorax sp. NCPPB 4044]MDA8521791.1 M20 family metallopeptidase [Acidovorax sp. NCPPB 4044]
MHTSPAPLAPPDHTRPMLDWLASQQDAMADLLREVVNTDSGSGHAEGVVRVAALLRARLESAGITVETRPEPGWGECLFARIPGQGPATGGHLQLMGHMDTVFPLGTAAERPWRVEGGKAYGPGVADMKSGLVMNVFVAEALARFGGNASPVHLFFTCDEEVGSPACRTAIREISQGARAVLNAEPGRISGNVVTERKGSYRIDFEVQGVAAHAGINPAQGASAIEALAHKVLALHALNGTEPGVTVNVGFIQGGMASNVVAPLAKAHVDLRYTAQNDLQALLDRIHAIVAEESVPRTSGRVTAQTGTLPMAPTPPDLLAAYQHSAAQVGFAVEGEFTGGAADSGITSSMGIPTLCALGPVGGYAHSEREFCDLSTFVPRAQALALTLVALG